jgi:hypothetical protein
MYTVSLTHLGNYMGDNESNNSIYGAEYSNAMAVTPYYERSMHYIDQKPWKNQNMDKTYMNYSKMMNEPWVDTYRELKLKPIPQINQEYITEGFSVAGTENFYVKLLFFIFVLFIIYYLIAY